MGKGVIVTHIKRQDVYAPGELKTLIGTGIIGTVYLLHFEQRIAPGHPCQHYLGWTDDLPQRLAAHKAGTGGRQPEVAKERGIAFTVARLWWDVDRYFEAWLKLRKEGPRFCLICSGAPALRRARAA